MEQRDYLDGNLYHMVHFANLESIFRRRTLLSKERVQQEGLSYHSIAYEEVQKRRDRIFIPIANLGDPCRRRYNPPDGPYGTNANRSNFYCGVACLERLNWDIINDRQFSGDERKRIKHAEVLIPDLLSIQKIQGIVVNNQKLLREVNALIDEFGLLGHIPYATFKPQLFFNKKAGITRIVIPARYL